jgi:hypothetical protein
MAMIGWAISPGSVSDEGDVMDDARVVGDDLISGCTIRLGEYVLITAAAVGVHITWDCTQK